MNRKPKDFNINGGFIRTCVFTETQNKKEFILKILQDPQNPSLCKR